jgi:hypothetical protein
MHVQEHACTRACRYKSVPVQGRAGTRAFRYKGAPVQKLASTSACRCKRMPVQEHADARACRCKSMPLPQQVQERADGSFIGATVVFGCFVAGYSRTDCFTASGKDFQTLHKAKNSPQFTSFLRPQSLCLQGEISRYRRGKNTTNHVQKCIATSINTFHEHS